MTLITRQLEGSVGSRQSSAPSWTVSWGATSAAKTDELP